MIFHLAISYIFLLSSLLYATGVYYEVLETEHLNRINIDAKLGLSYIFFAIDVDTLARACSIRLLTKNARLAVIQQNIQIILKLLFDDYHSTEYPLENDETFYNEQSKIQNRTDTSLDVFGKKFIRYDEHKGCLVVTKVVRNEQSVQIFKHYLIKIQLPSVGVLYSKMIARGIDLHFVLHIFPRIINSYEISFNIRAPSTPILTNVLNTIVTEFISKLCQKKGETIERPSLSTMKHLAKKFFKKNLNAQLHTIKQGQNGHLYVHLTSKPCTVYENRVFLGIGYLKNSIKAIEKCKLPLCPLVTNAKAYDGFYYCIYTYNPDENSKLKASNPKEYKQETATSLIINRLSLMRVPKDTVLSTYIVFSKECLIDFLNKTQKFDVKKIKDVDKHQCNEDASSSSKINNKHFKAFMSRFAAYLHTSANKNLLGEKSIWKGF